MAAESMMALGRVTGNHPVVPVRLNGMAALAAFEVDPLEHTRRIAIEAGAVTSTGLLHGLWALPEGIGVPVNSVPDHKMDLLNRAPHVASVERGLITRTYVPAGRIRAVGFAGKALRGAVRRVLRYAPLFERWAVVPADAVRSSAHLAEAREWNVGVIAVDGADSEVLVPAAQAVRGVPGVYRWWVVEVGYEAFLYENAQALSCALASTGPLTPARP